MDRICSECGMEITSDKLFMDGDKPVCANCKHIYVQRLREGVTADTPLPHGKLGIIGLLGATVVFCGLLTVHIGAYKAFDPERPMEIACLAIIAVTASSVLGVIQRRIRRICGYFAVGLSIASIWYWSHLWDKLC